MGEAQELVKLGRLVLRFARVERVTYHEDGKRKETDTDHTVMLGVVACSVAEKLYPHLNLGTIAQYALVHDLVEAYAGDTPTFNASLAVRAGKVERERKALEKIQKEFTSFSWVGNTILLYETQSDMEARFVKTLDKCMPKITHILNKGASLKEIGQNREDVAAFFDRQHKELREGYANEFPELMKLLREIMDITLQECYPT